MNLGAAIGVALLIAGCSDSAALDMSTPDLSIFGAFACPTTIADACTASCPSESALDAECDRDMGGRGSVSHEQCGAFTLVGWSSGVDGYSIYVYDSGTGALVAMLGQQLSGELTCAAGPPTLTIGSCGAIFPLC